MYVVDWFKYIIFDFYVSYKMINNLILCSLIENIINCVYFISYGDLFFFVLNCGRII